MKNTTKGQKETKSVYDMASEYGDNHDVVVFKTGKITERGGIMLYTDEGKFELTPEQLKKEFGVKEYVGNGNWKM